MASDETPVEQRLRDMVNWTDLGERHAIDCGREAIRLLRDFDRDEVNPADWDVYRRALLARCTSGAAMTDQTRETLAKLLDRENIEAARYWGHGDTRQQHHELNAAALRDVLTPRTCSTCKHFVAWFKDGVTANGYPEKRGDCKHRSYLGRRNGQSPDDGCIRGWQAREGEGGGHCMIQAQ